MLWPLAPNGFTLEAYSGNIMTLSFPKVAQHGILEEFCAGIIDLSVPRAPQPGILEAYSGDVMACSSQKVLSWSHTLAILWP